MKKRLFSLLLSLVLLISSAGALTPEQARELISRLYIDEVSQEVLDMPTVEEMFAALDVYSEYMSPQAYGDFMSTMNDVSQVGIGILARMTQEGDALELVEVYDGGAAATAGMKPGDFILAVDGKKVSTANKEMEMVTGWLRGEEGSSIAITLRREGGKTETITLTRTTFVIPYTTHELIDGHIGYISCTSFGRETYDHFIEALDDIESEVEQWIVDLRGNTGGDVQAAVDAAGIFGGTGLYSVLEQRGPQFYAFVAEKERTTMYPLILLVNEDSASASELMAAALRDRDAGLILGSRTYGKGVAQTVVDKTVEPEYFSEGDAVRITSSRFYSPDGIANDKIGVIPHLLVEDEYAQDIAYLLCAGDPMEDSMDYLRIHAGGWRWYVDLKQALKGEDGAYRPAFLELLEALWPGADVFMGAGGSRWEKVSVEEVAQFLELEEYTPRIFADSEDSRYQYEMDVLGTYGFLQGDEKGNVNPLAELTRADLCAMLAQTIRMKDQTLPTLFADVAADAWYAPAVNAMAAMGFVTGDGEGYFRPEEILTEEQMILIMGRFAAWLNADFHVPATKGPENPDMLTHTYLMKYSDWAKEGAWLMGMSHQNIYGDYISYVYDSIQKIDPQAPATRDKAAASLFRVLNLLGDMTE